MWKFMVIVALSARLIRAECGYDCEDNTIDHSGDGGFPGLPPTTVLGGKVTKLDDLAPIIFLNRTKAALNCESGVMQIDLKFEEAFYGIVFAEFDGRASSCSIVGHGNRTARIDLPLKGCGTRQEPVRVFTNNIVVRFHPSLEMDGDEVITIVCRYPPPVAPPPPPYPQPVKVPEPVPSPAQPLKGFQILLIICGILFLSLLLFGLAVSYYCLKNQRIRVVRRYPTKDEETLKGSDSRLSMFDTLTIPRAHPRLAPALSSSVSETPHGSETLPSDYPSESPSTAHSEAEDMDSRRRSFSSGGSYENKAYLPDISIRTEEQLQRRNETEVLSQETITRHMRPPPPEPKFDVQMRVKKPALPSPTSSASSSDTEGSLIMQERNLLTIEERDESLELRERPRHTFAYKPEIHAPPASHSPPIYSEVMRRSQEKMVSMPAPAWRSEEEIERSLGSYEQQSESRYAEYYQRTLSPIAEVGEQHKTELSTTLAEPPLVPTRRPEITSHVVDDVFLRTITEKKTIEDIERHRRQVTEYQQKAQLPPPKWDVVIRNYPDPNAQQQGGDETATDWESFSESSSIYGIPVASKSEFSPYGRNESAYRSQLEMEKKYTSTLDIPVPDPPPANWSALVRVLENSPEDMFDEYGETSYISEKYLTLEDKKKWRKIITTESVLRTLLTEATVKEDYERIRKDQRYEKLFEPEKWDVIIRILAPTSDRLFDQKSSGGSNKYRKKAEWDARSSRRNSLPTLYEYDSDGSSVRNIRLESFAQPGFDPLMRSRRTSRSSARSDMDVRSMSEVMVDFARQDVPDNMSDGSSYYRPRRYYDDDDVKHSDDEDGISLVRSVSQPSLARSASEFTETWGIRGRNWELSSPEHSPRSSTRSRTNQPIADSSSTSYATVKRSLYHQKRRWYGQDDDVE